MGRLYESLDADLAQWIRDQHLFFVATAPQEGGHINCSPKGLDTLCILDPCTIAYLDLTGSGAETVAHLRDNGRIVLMFCAFQGAPRILRIHGRGAAIQAGAPRFGELLRHFAPLSPQVQAGARSVILVEIERISTSCGFGVPLMRYEAERPQLESWVENRLRKHGPDALLQYQREKNAESIDGLPALDAAAFDSVP